MKKTFISLCLLLMTAGVLQAQSYHFSQFFSTPLLTNPAHTGFTEGPYRVASNFRSQGMPGGSPYFTGYVSADFSPLHQHLQEGHKAGVGLYMMNDQSQNGAFQTNAIGMSTAYNVGLDEYGDHTLGIGLQGTYHQRRLDYSKLSFGNQFGPGGYNASLPIGEALDARNKNYFDANAGIMYNALLEDRSYFVGLAAYNLLKHKENVLADEFKMPVRFTIQAGAQFYIGEYGKAYFSATNMTQAGAHETTVGSAFGLQLGERDIKNEINFGMWYRWKDALIPYVGYHLNTVQVGLSYDYTVSSLKTAAQVKNGFELTLIYKPIDKTELKTLIPWY